MAAVTDAVYGLTDHGVRVLSPADPRVVDQFGDFVFVASDRARVIKLVESRHLAAIKASDFVWLVDPDGYIGASGAMELGYAAAVGTPVYCPEVPSDLTLRRYVTTVPTIENAVERVRRKRVPCSRSAHNVLLDPDDAVEAGHLDLEHVLHGLTGSSSGEDLARAAAARLDAQVVGPLRPH